MKYKRRNSLPLLYIMKKNSLEFKVQLITRAGLNFEYQRNGLKFNLRASQGIKIFQIVFKIFITENNGQVNVSLAMKVIFMKNEFFFDHFSRILTVIQKEPILFFKNDIFFERYFSIRKTCFKIHYGHIIALMQKSRSLLASKID